LKCKGQGETNRGSYNHKIRTALKDDVKSSDSGKNSSSFLLVFSINTMHVAQCSFCSKPLGGSVPLRCSCLFSECIINFLLSMFPFILSTFSFNCVFSKKQFLISTSLSELDVKTIRKKNEEEGLLSLHHFLKIYPKCRQAKSLFLSLPSNWMGFFYFSSCSQVYTMFILFSVKVPNGQIYKSSVHSTKNSLHRVHHGF
jgi:hypothetical protein